MTEETEWVDISEGAEHAKVGGHVQRWGLEPNRIVRVDLLHNGDSLVFLDDGDIWPLGQMADGGWEILALADEQETEEGGA